MVMIIQLAEQLLSAVKHIHERCWLHRDLKPGNIMISEAVKDSVLSFSQKDGELTMSRKQSHKYEDYLANLQIKVGDFGLARMM